MKLFLKALALGCVALPIALVAFSDIALAQTDTRAVQKPFRIKVGGAFTGGKIEAGGIEYGKIDYRPNAGLSYDFTKTNATNPIVLSVYGDYFMGNGDKSVTLAGQTANFEYESTTFAIGIAARYTLTPPTTPGGHPYAELGVGYYSTKLKEEVGTLSESKTEGSIGGKVALGYQLANGIFGEFEYSLIPQFETRFANDLVDTKYNPSAIRASLGYRF